MIFINIIIHYHIIYDRKENEQTELAKSYNPGFHLKTLVESTTMN